MSWKGFTRGVTRAPQNFKSKFNIGEITKDAIYVDAERRFQELETETKKLHDESKKYFDAINSMLSHQIEFSKACAEIYKPISGRMSDPDSFIDEGNPEGIRACEEYENIVKDLQETLKPELELIEMRVIKPADELLEIIKVVRKATVKRDHKQLDHDRHRTNLKKLQDKKDKTLKDEKAMYRAEADVEQATQDFNYFNELLKDELPKLFRLEREFIRPLFQSFYYMQLNVFYTLHERMQSIDIGYFDLTLEIEDSFERKRGEIQQETEKLSITHFKTTGGRPRNTSKYGQSKLALEGRPEQKRLTMGESSNTSTTAAYASPSLTTASSPAASPPPPYSPANGSALSPGRVSSTGGWGAAAKSKGAAPPPPKPKPARLSGAPAAETATALYDYEAQAEGDLSFNVGEVIEIVQRGASEMEWWTGRIGAKQGQFPGNYVRVN